MYILINNKNWVLNLPHGSECGRCAADYLPPPFGCLFKKKASSKFRSPCMDFPPLHHIKLLLLHPLPCHITFLKTPQKILIFYLFIYYFWNLLALKFHHFRKKKKGKTIKQTIFNLEIVYNGWPHFIQIIHFLFLKKMMQFLSLPQFPNGCRYYNFYII